MENLFHQIVNSIDINSLFIIVLCTAFYFVVTYHLWKLLTNRKDLQKEIETTFWMRYERRKMKECVNTLHNLASAFLIEEKQEEEKDRYRLFLKKRLKENRIFVV